MVFGDYFPHPGGKALNDQAPATTTPVRAFTAEMVGTAILVLVIFCATDEHNAPRPQVLTAATVGLTTTLIISLIGPLMIRGSESGARFCAAPLLLPCRLGEGALYD